MQILTQKIIIMAILGIKPKRDKIEKDNTISELLNTLAYLSYNISCQGEKDTAFKITKFL
jgi:hypothetical protein